MKIAYLAAANSIHTVRWVNGLSARGNDILLLSVHSPLAGIDARVKTVKLTVPAPLGYFINKQQILRELKQFQPDLLHAHYASGYGTLARKLAFEPTLLSVWGADVYDFPRQSKWKQKLLCQNLKAASALASTSEVMALETKKWCSDKAISVTPFGIDIQAFRPIKSKPPGPFVIGTVKTLAPKYGIDLLLRAFALALQQGLSKDSELHIVGEGPQKQDLIDLSRNLKLQKNVNFMGAIAHTQVPEVLNHFDLYVALSTLDSESFGVAILEASACALPVIVSDVGGLPEVVRNAETGFIVPNGDIEAASKAMLRIWSEPDLGSQLGQSGREHVVKNYSWESSLNTMETVYQQLIKNTALNG